MGRESKPYATMKDGPDAYLFRKDGKQKLVGSADNEPEAGEEELEEGEGYSYRDEVDYEEDNSKIWHYGKAPGGDWEIIDRSPYAEMDDFAWNLYVDFHKQNGHWPDKNESRKIEELEHKVMTKMNDDINEIRKLAGLEIVAEDCDETPGDDKNDDGDCSPFTHADDNVDMVREDDFEEDFLAPPKEIEDGHYEDDDDDWKMQGGEDNLSAFDRDMSDSEPFGDDYYDEDANTHVGREFASSEFGGEGGNTHVGRKFASGEIEEGPGDDEFDADPDAMVDVGDDEDYEVFDFDDEFDAMMGNTMKYESVVEMNELRKAAGIAQVDEDKGMVDFTRWYEYEHGDIMSQVYWLKSQLPPAEGSSAYARNWNKVVKNLSKKNPPPEGWVNPVETPEPSEQTCPACRGRGHNYEKDDLCYKCGGEGTIFESMNEEGVMEGEGDTCSRCRKGTMEVGDTFFGPAERCNRCGYQRSLSESAPHGSDDYDFIDFADDKAYFLVADEIGDRIIFGMNNEVGVPEQYTDEMIGLLRKHGFEKGIDYNFTVRGNSNHISNREADVEEDLQNGYGNHNYADSYDDYFPRGSHQTPSNDLGPTAGELGDNPMRSPMASTDRDEVYEGMRQKYRRYRLS